MRELNAIECQEISGGIGVPTWCQTKCFFKSPTGITVIVAGLAAAIGAFYTFYVAE